MSYAESFWTGQRAGGTREDLPEEFVAEYPAIAQVLCGVPSQEEGKPSIPPASITLFAEGARLKFVISPKTGNRVAFGCVRDPVKGLAGLDSELQAGSFEWKLAKRRNSS